MNNLLIQQLNKHKYITIIEPYIRTTNSLRKPDILTYKVNSDTVYIIDTQKSIDTTYIVTITTHSDYYKPHTSTFIRNKRLVVIQ